VLRSIACRHGALDAEIAALEAELTSSPPSPRLAY
jgi:hypothetical protein